MRVERTGRDQRDGVKVHAEDVRDYLERNMGVPPAQIRVKSSYDDELGREDLLSERSAVRWIITRAALMEGWDCPFAYLLVLLDNTRSKIALTQLVGRILRQPHARLTGDAALDRSYVYCWNMDVKRAVDQVRAGLQAEGLGDLGNQVESLEGSDPTGQRRIVQRREAYQSLDIRVPKVLHRHRGGWRKLDHLQDILAEVDWDAVRLQAFAEKLLRESVEQRAVVDLDKDKSWIAADEALDIDKTLRVGWFARRLSDVVPNPWQAAKFTQELFAMLRNNGRTDDDIFDNRAVYAEQLRAQLSAERDRLCRAIFERKLDEGVIRFDFYTEPSFRLKKTMCVLLAKNDHTLEHVGGDPVQLSLFDRVFESQFDSALEKDFAFHLDNQLQRQIDEQGQEQPRQWWHRVKREYYVLGWRQQRIYPDFVAFGKSSVNIFETKGAHLRGNADTEYKTAVFQLLEQHFNGGQTVVRIEEHQHRKGKFMIVYDSDFPAIPS